MAMIRNDMLAVAKAMDDDGCEHMHPCASDVHLEGLHACSKRQLASCS